jgi:hypothetical protein
MKTCRGPCRQHKRNEEFSEGNTNGHCTPCQSAAEKKSCANNPARFARRKKEAGARYRAAWPKKHRMQLFVRSAKNKGILIPGPCEICGDVKVDGHHDDYNKPLEVRWLCRTHHKRWHRENGPGKNAEGPADAGWQELLLI